METLEELRSPLYVQPLFGISAWAAISSILWVFRSFIIQSRHQLFFFSFSEYKLDAVPAKENSHQLVIYISLILYFLSFLWILQRYRLTYVGHMWQCNWLPSRQSY